MSDSPKLADQVKRAPDIERPTKWPATVRTTIQPEVYLEVDASEWHQLHVQGLLIKEGK